MKIVVGIDNLAQGKLVLNLLQNLNFAEPALKLVNVVEVWIDQASTQAGFGPIPYSLEGYFKLVENEARQTLMTLQEGVDKQRFTECQTQLLYGNISNQLMNAAAATKADLLAIGSFGKGPIEGVLLGSVGRKAVINSEHSVLVAKDSYRSDRQLSVVLATDHSPYAKAWLERFIQWAPRGIKRLTLVTVLPEAFFKSDIGPWIREGLNLANQEAVAQLKVLGTELQSRVEVGAVSPTLTRVMQETDSDLLVLGSQGHGFMERVSLGSTSLEQVVKSPYSVLVVRA